MSLYNKVLSSLGWSFLGETINKVFPPIIFIILANILSPDDFGVVAAAMIIISFSQIICESGFAKAIVQRKEHCHLILNTAFWMNVALGIALFFLMFFSANLFSILFDDERIADVVKILSVQIIFASISSIFIAVHQRDFKFKNIFFARSLTNILPALISIPYALNDGGYWALVYSALFANLIQLCVLWWQCKWKLSTDVDLREALKLFLFSRWIILSALLGWFFLWVDGMVVVSFLGTFQLGIYRTANLAVMAVFGLAMTPIFPVLYSTLSEFKTDFSKIKRVVIFVNRVLAMIVIPIGITLLLTNNFLAELLFDKRWSGIGPIIGIIGIAQALAYTVSVNQEVYKSIGRPEVETKIMAISMLIRIPFYLISIQYGLYAFAIARLISTAFGVLNHLFFANRIIGVSFLDYFKCLVAPVLSGIIMFTFNVFINQYFAIQTSSFLQFLILLTINTATYLLSIAIINHAFLRKAFSVVTGKEKI